YADVLYQISALQGLAQVAGTSVRYVKPHGALYNTIATNLVQAKAVIDAILAYDSSLVLVALAGSPLIEFARKQGLRVVSEAFADRAYHRDGTLVS
ncbi:LamB/YcsF family protein, partial [Escherichia coli]